MGITLDTSKIHFVFLQGRKWVEDSTWPRFTLLGQSIGSMILAAEAFTTLLPDLYIGELLSRRLLIPVLIEV
jgi:alpha-1,2-mannosyltransferase